MVMLIQSLFPMIAKKPNNGLHGKRVLYCLVCDIMNIRKDLGFKNDVMSIYSYKEDIVDHLSYKYPNIKQLIQAILEIPKVKAYIDVKREIEDRESHADTDTDSVEDETDVYESDEDDESESISDSGSESESDSDDDSSEYTEESSSSCSSSSSSLMNCVMVKRPFLRFLFATSLCNLVISSAIAYKMFK